MTADGLYFQVMRSEQLAALPHLALVAYCYRHARYTIVTQELLDWLRSQIAGRSVLEVGAGQGDLGHHLGIRMTDSGQAASQPLLQLLYALKGQRVTNPPPSVERITANEAVIKYTPQVVIASWLTQLYKEEDPPELQGQSSVFGTDEEEIIRGVDTYIHIGNLAVHNHKRVLRLPHREYQFPWLWSRAQFPQLNRIWVWSKS